MGETYNEEVRNGAVQKMIELKLGEANSPIYRTKVGQELTIRRVQSTHLCA